MHNLLFQQLLTVQLTGFGLGGYGQAWHGLAEGMLRLTMATLYNWLWLGYLWLCLNCVEIQTFSFTFLSLSLFYIFLSFLSLSLSLPHLIVNVVRPWGLLLHHTVVLHADVVEGDAGRCGECDLINVYCVLLAVGWIDWVKPIHAMCLHMDGFDSLQRTLFCFLWLLPATLCRRPTTEERAMPRLSAMMMTTTTMTMTASFNNTDAGAGWRRSAAVILRPNNP